METLHRITMALVIAFAHWAAWPAITSPVDAQPEPVACACAVSGHACTCTGCACNAKPEPQQVPSQPDRATPPASPKAPAPDHPGVVTVINANALPPSGTSSAHEHISHWLGDSPFASWCVWRT